MPACVLAVWFAHDPSTADYRGTSPSEWGGFLSADLAHRAGDLAPALEHLGVDLAPVRGEVDDQAGGDALVAGDHAVGDLVPARHHSELVEDLVGQQGLGARA